ncbi:hypothetical protein HKX48_001240 [Thoreauomyces humboldtii]|nr:hypothetical protein HKX48_001240 [Thoreauomyces humboldtii]
MSRSHRPKSADNELLSLLSSNTIGSIGNYVFGKTLGEGTFGKVKLARHILTGQEVAVKIVDKIHAPTVVREIETWRHMHHPNITPLYEILLSETRIYMVMEYCTGGEAFDHVCTHGRFEDRGDDARRIFRQLVEAVGYCHDKKFVHRDLKLENVLLTKELNVKLIDFGFTRNITKKNLLDTYCGSVAYAAPEMILNKRYSGPQADVWSLGVILYTFVCGYLPFDDDSEQQVRHKILHLDYSFPSHLAPQTIDLITRMLKTEGDSRLRVADILAHPWFVDDAGIPTVVSHPEIETEKERDLARRLGEAGLDVDAMMRSVRSNTCDQASALWYLLLNKSNAPLSPTSPEDPSDAMSPDISSSDYLARMRQKALERPPRATDSASAPGRRGMVIKAAMRGKNGSPAGGGAAASPPRSPLAGPGRRRWDQNRDAARPGVGVVAPPETPKQGWSSQEEDDDDDDEDDKSASKVLRPAIARAGAAKIQKPATWTEEDEGVEEDQGSEVGRGQIHAATSSVQSESRGSDGGPGGEEKDQHNAVPLALNRLRPNKLPPSRHPQTWMEEDEDEGGSADGPHGDKTSPFRR